MPPERKATSKGGLASSTRAQHNIPLPTTRAHAWPSSLTALRRPPLEDAASLMESIRKIEAEMSEMRTNVYGQSNALLGPPPPIAGRRPRRALIRIAPVPTRLLTSIGAIAPVVMFQSYKRYATRAPVRRLRPPQLARARARPRRLQPRSMTCSSRSTTISNASPPPYQHYNIASLVSPRSRRTQT